MQKRSTLPLGHPRLYSCMPLRIVMWLWPGFSITAMRQTGKAKASVTNATALLILFEISTGFERTAEFSLLLDP